MSQGEAFSKLKKGYKPILVKKKSLVCEHGCLGTFRSEWDKQQHMIYAHESENGATTLRSINEAVRGLGKKSSDQHTYNAESKRPGEWIFVPRESQSGRNYNDRHSSKTGNSHFRKSTGGADNGSSNGGGLSRMLSLSKIRSDYPKSPNRSIRFQNISNPIPHQNSLDMAERIGEDLEVAQRHQRQISIERTGTARPSTIHTKSGPFENPITLEDKDFETSSESGSDYSAPSSPRISTPPDLYPNLPMDDSTGAKRNIQSLTSLPPIQVAIPRPPARPSPHGSFSRPTPSAYPLLLRQYLDSQPQSPTSFVDNIPKSPLSPSARTHTTSAPTRPPRPPIPSRSPARINAGTASEDGHPPCSYRTQGAPIWLRKSPSHSALRI